MLKVELEADGTISLNGSPVASRAAMDAVFARVAAQPNPAEVHIFPSPIVEYKYLAAVLTSASRAGLTRFGVVGLVGLERFAHVD